MAKNFSIPLDDLLLQRLRRHCRGSQSKVYQLYASACWTLARRLTGCDALAWDVVQDSFVQAFHSISQLRDGARFGAWLRRILVSQAMDLHRRKQREHDYKNSQQNDFTQQTQAPDPCWLDLEKALASLSATDRMVLWLHDVEGMTHDEIAAIGGHSKSWSKSRLVRARARMQALLEPEANRPLATAADTAAALNYRRGYKHG